MTLRLLRAIAVTVACLLPAGAGTAASASGASGSKGTAPGSDIKNVPSGAIGARSTSIVGAAWNADNTPIPNAKLRLRNVQTGRIEATAVANEAGQFAFTGVESGTFVIELVSDTGKVLTLGARFTVAPGETLATFVRMGTKIPWFSSFFSNAAAAASSAAASTGVTAIAPEEIRPVSAGQ